ncbi:hypothetical protein KY290_033518 [Solanum tuberosum]|uniref:Integrase core domain containing protein n=1 Tax=Solanum tuberosum TaxID=4113 RepID=A0ABQ7U127_SOLTU|nr:hypothetical protein KY285_032769 [Solanum tuberosum]KAH0740475.1 hypothetical protein KY290_033518 [Solanum tuberosum]
MNQLKVFKAICDGLASIHKPVNDDSKVINFARGLGLKYKTIGTVMPGSQKSPSSGSQERKIIDECQIYGRNNNTIQKCFYKWDYSYQAADELPQALTTTNLQNTNDDTLYVDSGASSHMTHNSGQEDKDTTGQGI